MNLEQWSFLAEIIASISVILTLCFLAYQIRLHARQAQLDSMDLVTSRRHDLLHTLAEDGELAAIVWKGLAGTPRLPAHEWSRFSLYLYTVLLEYERTWLKGKAGMLDVDFKNNWEQAMVWWFQHPGTRAWWRGDHPGFNADFTVFINDALTRIEVNPLVATAVAAAFREHERPLQPAMAPEPPARASSPAER